MHTKHRSIIKRCDSDDAVRWDKGMYFASAEATIEEPWVGLVRHVVTMNSSREHCVCVYRAVHIKHQIIITRWDSDNAVRWDKGMYFASNTGNTWRAMGGTGPSCCYHEFVMLQPSLNRQCEEALYSFMSFWCQAVQCSYSLQWLSCVCVSVCTGGNIPISVDRERGTASPPNYNCQTIQLWSSLAHPSKSLWCLTMYIHKPTSLTHFATSSPVCSGQLDSLPLHDSRGFGGTAGCTVNDCWGAAAGYLSGVSVSMKHHTDPQHWSVLETWSHTSCIHCRSCCYILSRWRHSSHHTVRALLTTHENVVILITLGRMNMMKQRGRWRVLLLLLWPQQLTSFFSSHS